MNDVFLDFQQSCNHFDLHVTFADRCRDHRTHGAATKKRKALLRWLLCRVLHVSQLPQT